MSTKIVTFVHPASAHPSLLKAPSETVPGVDELESLHEELKKLKRDSQERAKKAGHDLKTIEDSMRRMKEREKGKAKAIDKSKPERECA